MAAFDNGTNRVREQAEKLAGRAAAKARRLVEEAEDSIEDFPAFLAGKIRPHSPRVADAVKIIHIDSPFTTVFLVLCVGVHLLNSLIPMLELSKSYFAVYPWGHCHLLSPLTYWRMFSHVLGHGSWGHLQGNMVNLLLCAPGVERHFGALGLLKIVFTTAVSSGLAHILLGPSNAVQLGASGVLFALLMLQSLVEAKTEGSTGSKGRIPLTFIVQAVLWCWSEVISQLFKKGSGTSHIAHLSGALVGVWLGYHLNSKQDNKHD